MNKKNLSIEETFTLAVQNHKKNNFEIAQDLYEKILKISPDHFKVIFLLGTLSAQTKNFDKAKQLLQKATQIQPNNADAHNNLGSAQKETGENQKAINSYEKAIQINSNYANTHNNLGVVLKEVGKYKKAISCFEKAIQINPNYVEAHNKLGGLLIELGRYHEALECYRKQISINPQQTNAINNLGVLLRLVRLKNITQENKKNLKELFLFLFRRNDISHADIFTNAKLVLFSEENYSKIRQIDISKTLLENPIIKNLMKEELFLLMLQKCLIVDHFLEKILTKLRYEILLTSITPNKNILLKNFEFIISLTEQCFFNEYVYAQSKKEIDYITQLKNKIENNKKINELEIAILGCYIHLYSSENIINKLLNYKSKNILFNDLITMQIKEPLKEKELVNSIRSLGKISDVVSKKVRDQYEEHPYPRWRHAYKNLPHNFLIKLNNQIKPNSVEINNKFDKLSVLIAGCGTGSHVCIVEDYLNAKILAVDISVSSLAYAKRKTEELGFKNIEFLHADILQLKNLNKKFDVIESVGVLHHMKNPMKGIKILLNLLKPHGFMKLGLYSEIARQDITKVREFIKKNKFKNTIEDIRSCRQKIINEKKDKILQKICNRRDFYSTSSVKDLTFHVQEHCFTLPQISKILLDSNLEFLGFTGNLIKNKYSKLYPSDKKNISFIKWNKFEISFPETFMGMYNFWVRKKVD